MFDIKWIRANADAFDAAMGRRKNVSVRSSDLLAIDDRRREIISRLNEAQEKRNTLSKQVGQAKAQKDEAKAAELMAEVARLKEFIPSGEAEERAVEKELRDVLSAIPNMAFEDVPVGDDESGNVEYFGPNGSPATAAQQRPAKPSFSFAPKEHFDIGVAEKNMDFEAAAKLSGSRFVVLKGQIARLERALGQFMLDLHTTEFGFTEVQPPVLVRDEAMYGTGQLPKFDGDFFFTEHGDSRLALIPTAEVPMTNLVRESILAEEELPIRFTALTPCFRSEAGSAGRDTRGMLRQHQFNKVELVAITTPEEAVNEHERMLLTAETVLQRLGLHYRVMTLCTGDLGFGARKTYDIEVWLPGQDTYREISSVSVCGDFQARRMEARYRPSGEKQAPRYVHTLNGSGTAVGRCLIAVLENYQQEDGSVVIPEALRPYMGGLTSIGGR
ncbi:serine--tRNA ligase [Devosia sp. 63-57]|uniref:serine--tRNA ligase n=1 Tax=Devosia sp. 63-57 TaxID=1895751 RepID=UPI00086B3E02|nr:serine--tRNA ligase [Devosia sp. 63-57]ODT48644.1 MAG: serine--tRNA ligase [Pelagibacterium sp. SCN 63-126]ODU86526.1 MAG: serine--tRNA ligase [Pelagibacterium sp. SCN 63-17]OJX45104.1 MAG: serine--tRNA ligase [Devosia sp. 63-57]